MGDQIGPSVVCRSCVVGEQRIRVSVTRFADRICVFAFGDLGSKFGAVVDCQRDASSGVGGGEGKTFEVSTLLGDRENMWLKVLGRQLVENTVDNKPVLLMSSLVFGPDEEEDIIRAVVEKFIEIYKL
mmetsp:Transcript_12798/g.20699  ORF Transcript_12798/g.20699 Transcript_12798/m.20699 type:complete len:128 (+) Transcript_12798:820-1203(+)|eukprot:CAMPEP_0203761430 /NCGR_PEP_ID=MMETSP0098-20131031/14522_1 /ASSEMBLY_ACC=CAM_ASM_000208 /TAXON_ID=96639 /ORGANISM=" , Strain NY0313808BC1" /LENGTH=127 /DNA_ID=CAMNT_0050655425 /DNA_START=151 /DNA_END=534 /DNA_ORIENTATION=-